MGAAAIEQVKNDAERAVRNLPSAHASWQFVWRNASFRRAISAVDKAAYAINVDKLSDESLDVLAQIIRLVIKMIEIHVSELVGGTRDLLDRQYFQDVIHRLEIAADGLEQGLPPDPSKRPTRDQLLDRFAGMLSREPLNLPDRTDCARSGTS